MTQPAANRPGDMQQSDLLPGSPERLRTDPRLLLEVRRLSKVSELRGLRAIAIQWTVIFSTIVLWCNLPADLGPLRWVLYAAGVILIGSRQHAFLILMHEGAHFRISEDKRRNDFLSDLFCALPLGISTELYRRLHLKHHQHTNTEKDPDWKIIQNLEEWRWPKDNIKALWLFTSDLIGLGAHKIIASLIRYSPALKLFYKRDLKLKPNVRIGFVAFYCTVILLLTLFDLWFIFLLFWVVPFLTALLPIARLRSAAEHMVVKSEHELNKSRHVDSNWFERLLVAPLNVNYHLTHHLYPSIPFYNLPEMHQILMDEEVFRKNAHITNGYWGLRSSLWQELTHPRRSSH